MAGVEPQARRYDLCAYSDALTDTYHELDPEALGGLGLMLGRSILIDSEGAAGIESQLAGSTAIAVCAGGSPANTACGLVRLGGSACLIGVVGDDDRGRRYLAEMERVGVEPRFGMKAGPSGICYTMLSPSGERSFGFAPGVAVELEIEDLALEAIAASRWFHTSAYQLRSGPAGIPAMRAAFAAAHAAGTQISLDLGDAGVIEQHYSVLCELLARPIALLLVTVEEGRALAQVGPEAELDEIARRLEGYAELLIIKRASRGCVVLREGKLLKVPALKVKAIDDNGAGDSFAAGFIKGLLDAHQPMIAARIGCYYASLVVSKLGSQDGKTIDDVAAKSREAFQAFGLDSEEQSP